MLRTVRSNTLRTLKSIASSRASSAKTCPSSNRIPSMEIKMEANEDDEYECE